MNLLSYLTSMIIMNIHSYIKNNMKFHSYIYGMKKSPS